MNNVRQWNIIDRFIINNKNTKISEIAIVFIGNIGVADNFIFKILIKIL